ncbi:YCF48-related protein [Halopseudomonas sp. SMJS2]|uniref:WD40/YVTN/BNR-like repeat-containing protein n=1 Tax=Halopseudomonas sp. SMJS2 TaxID=3041098 RepID=UPI00245334F9|nr:YCF48-related protein [Halopseudomonas sp. SMJS2]WGK62470.1 YCF48-related protein [Halopseudomonas sp. SMJS2]
MSKFKFGTAAIIMALSMTNNAAEINVIYPLDKPAEFSHRAIMSRLTDVVTAPGGRVVVVGERGHILYTDNLGSDWTQALVPVSSDLVAVAFSDQDHGWAVGHDGVVLKTTDGGVNWEMVLNGRTYGDILVSFYERALAQDSNNEKAERALAESQRFQDEGADKPFLDVFFEDEHNGWVVGAFNLILKTSDGGETWEPWVDRTDNPMSYSFFSIERVGTDIYIAGELGLLLRLDREQDRFLALDTPYEGSFFGLAGNNRTLVAYGLRGQAFFSGDRGETWSHVETGLRSGIVDGQFLQDGRAILAASDGEMVVGDARHARFKPFSDERRVALSAISQVNADTLLLVGANGARSVKLH